MAIISNVRNDGWSAVTTGPKKVNSYNVAPSNVVALPSPGLLFHYTNAANYDYFNVAQTSAGTDFIVLNSTFPIGSEINFYCISACKVGTVSGSGIGINGGTDAQFVTLAANSLYVFLKTSATTWICGATAANGTFSAPTPA